jgi:hypothetical protein
MDRHFFGNARFPKQRRKGSVRCFYQDDQATKGDLPVA